MDTNVIAKPKDYVLVGGKPMTVDVIDDQTVRFNLPAPKPGLLAHFASHYGQGFQSKKFLGQFHPAVNGTCGKNSLSSNGYWQRASKMSLTPYFRRPSRFLPFGIRCVIGGVR